MAKSENFGHFRRARSAQAARFLTAADSTESTFASANMSTTATTQLVHNTRLDIYKAAHTTRRSGIICTIGPASASVEVLTSLMKAGLNVVRLNFSHGTHPYHLQTIKNARQAAASLNTDICIVLDTKGHEIRTGNFVDCKEVTLALGSDVRITVDPKQKDKSMVRKKQSR